MDVIRFYRMNIFKINPRKELRKIVSLYWYATTQHHSNEFTNTYSIIADGAPGLIIQHFNGHSAVFDEDNSPLPVSFAYGHNINPCINRIKGSPFIFGVNFKPTIFRTLFDINTSALTNSILNTEYVFSKQFNDRLLNSSTPQKIIQLLNKKLTRYLANLKEDKILVKSIHLILQNTTDWNSANLSSYLNISRRHFQRKFKEHVGVTPETYVRIVKFQKSIHLLKYGHYEKLSDISYELNYADQSHFNREFKLFSGYTPKEFLETSTVSRSHNPSSKYIFEPLRIVKH